MSGFLPQGDEVPEHVGILEMCLRVPFLSVNEAREQDGISDEEDRGIVPYQVPVPFLSVEFESKSTRITGCVS